MKAYKKLSTAEKHANGKPIIKVGDLFIVGGIDRLTELAILSPDCFYGGYITAGHLNRLGNGNHAEAKRTIEKNVF